MEGYPSAGRDLKYAPHHRSGYFVLQVHAQLDLRRRALEIHPQVPIARPVLREPLPEVPVGGGEEPACEPHMMMRTPIEIVRLDGEGAVGGGESVLSLGAVACHRRRMDEGAAVAVLDLQRIGAAEIPRKKPPLLEARQQQHAGLGRAVGRGRDGRRDQQGRQQPRRPNAACSCDHLSSSFRNDSPRRVPPVLVERREGPGRRAFAFTLCPSLASGGWHSTWTSHIQDDVHRPSPAGPCLAGLLGGGHAAIAGLATMRVKLRLLCLWSLMSHGALGSSPEPLRARALTRRVPGEPPSLGAACRSACDANA